jgi:hypothetical protein
MVSIMLPTKTMKRYALLAVLGLAGGALGEGLGVQCVNFLPKEILFNDADLLPITFMVLQSPFFAVAYALLFKFQGYTSFLKGFVFSIAYYFPFQHKAIWINLTRKDILFHQYVGEPIVITFLGALLLSGIYYLLIRLQRRHQRNLETQPYGVPDRQKKLLPPAGSFVISWSSVPGNRMRGFGRGALEQFRGPCHRSEARMRRVEKCPAPRRRPA